MHDRWNAFVDLDPAAHAGKGALADMTIGIKSNIMVKGLPWTAGMALYRNRIAERDAEVVAKLRAAGAAILGTLNMEEAALGAKTDNPWFGATQNPHRSGHTPGGSSGGSAAAVAAGLCDVALGSDTMGSVRIPASYCGVYGFKPANAAVPQDGLEVAEASLDVIGPIARSIDSLERLARVMSDFGEGEITAAGSTLDDLGGVECTDDVLQAYDITLKNLVEPQSVTLPFALSRVRFAGFIKTVRAISSRFDAADLALLSPGLRNLLRYAAKRSLDDWEDDQRVLSITSDYVREMVSRCGFMLLPTAPQAAFSHNCPAPANQADFTCIANIAGLPAISLPAGWSEDDLPIGVQLIGQAGHEAGLISLARALDRSLDAYRAPVNP